MYNITSSSRAKYIIYALFNSRAFIIASYMPCGKMKNNTVSILVCMLKTYSLAMYLVNK